MCLSEFIIIIRILDYYEYVWLCQKNRAQDQIVKFQDKSTETFNKLTRDYWDIFYSENRFFRYHKVLLDCQERVEDEPQTEENMTMRILIWSDQCLMIKMFGKLTLISCC